LQLTDCIILDEQTRQRKDTVFASFLSNLRYGTCNEQHYNYIKNNLLYKNQSLLNETSWFNANVIVSRSNVRIHINNVKSVQYTKSFNEKLLISPSVDTISKKMLRNPHHFQTPNYLIK
jgi:hypothetical protein